MNRVNRVLFALVLSLGVVVALTPPSPLDIHRPPGARPTKKGVFPKNVLQEGLNRAARTMKPMPDGPLPLRQKAVKGSGDDSIGKKRNAPFWNKPKDAPFWGGK